MASITKLDGGKYRAFIYLKLPGKDNPFRQTKTFPTKREATLWAHQRNKRCNSNKKVVSSTHGSPDNAPRTCKIWPLTAVDVNSIERVLGNVAVKYQVRICLQRNPLLGYSQF